MKVYERLASAFAAEGVTAVFGMMGTSTMHWAEAAEKLGIRYLAVRHEGVGLGMADGWARATHTVGVCSATEGPGVTQLATALVTASRAGSPVVAFVGECAATDYENAQQLDQARFAASCEAGFVRVDSPDTADDAVRRAFLQAKLESRPVMLSAPIDIQKMDFEGDEPYLPSSARYSTDVTASPNAAKLEQAATLIASSRRPVIVVGRGARWSGAGDAVLKLARRIGALVSTTLQTKAWLAEDEYHVGISGFFGTKTALQFFEEADCVIAIGASMNRYTLSGGYLYPNARIVQLDSKPHIMMGGGRGADCYIQCDARTGVEALEALLATRSVSMTGYRNPEVCARLAHNFDDPTEFPIEPGCVDPRRVCTALDELLPAHINLHTATGAVSRFSNMLFNRPRPVLLTSYFFGCVGQSLPSALGAIVATGKKPMVLVDGDAGFMMHLADFDTAVRYELPLLAVVLNDEALGSEYHRMRALNMNTALSTIPTPDLGAVATSLGAAGRLARSVDDVRAAAEDWLAKPRPMIIDVRISRNVLSLPHRRLLYAKDE
jgi:thiamine pyrophosphate-dependent acetolactate synthase large subunit-like protein